MIKSLACVWENEYCVTWVIIPFASDIVSHSLLSGELIDSLAYRSLKVIFDGRSLSDSFLLTCTMAGMQALSDVVTNHLPVPFPFIFEQGFKCFTTIQKKIGIELMLSALILVVNSVISWVHFIKRYFSNAVLLFISIKTCNTLFCSDESYATNNCIANLIHKKSNQRN